MASKTKYVTLKGIAVYPKVFPDLRDWGYDDELRDSGGQYVLALSIEDEEMDKLIEAHSQAPDYAKDIETRDGTVYKNCVKLKRFHEKYNKKGELLEWASGAPKVVKADGSAWSFEDDGAIGNGSVVECDVVVYKAGSVYGTRLERIKVIDHVPMPELLVA